MFKMPISPYKLRRTFFIFISLRSSLLFLAPVQSSRSLGPSPDLSARSALPGSCWVLLVPTRLRSSHVLVRVATRGYMKSDQVSITCDGLKGLQRSWGPGAWAARRRRRGSLVSKADSKERIVWRWKDYTWQPVTIEKEQRSTSTRCTFATVRWQSSTWCASKIQSSLLMNTSSRSSCLMETFSSLAGTCEPPHLSIYRL